MSVISRPTRRRRSWAASGTCQVRYGKAMRGSPPRRRSVASVMPWAIEALGQYLDEVRPRYGAAGVGAGVVADRAGRADLGPADR